MSPTLVALATDLQAAAAFNPGEASGKFRALFAGLIVAALLFVSLVALVKYGRKGDASGGAKVTGAVFLCLIPAAMAGLGAVAILTGSLKWLFPSLGA